MQSRSSLHHELQAVCTVYSQEIQLSPTVLGSSPLGIPATCRAHPCSGPQHLARHPHCLPSYPQQMGWFQRLRSADLPSFPFQRPLVKFLSSHLLRSPGVWQKQVLYPYLTLALPQVLTEGLPPTARHRRFWQSTHTLSGRGRLL